MTSTWDIFLAHAHADADSALRLYELLAPHVKVFLDARCILLGDDWDLTISRALRETRVIVTLVSSRYEPAYYLREEIAVAIELARSAPDAHRVVPIFLDGVPGEASGVPYGLRLKNGLDAGQLGLPAVAARLRELVARLAARGQA